MPGRLILCLALLAAGVQVALAETASRFQRTVEALQQGEESARSRFASLAVLELAEIYLAEADLARSESQDSDSAGRLLSWSRAVERYAAQLLLVQEDLDLGYPVLLRSHSREAPSITVADRTVFLAHPRRGQQGAYEQSVLAQFCTGYTCAELTSRASEHAEPIPMSPGVVSPAWNFSSAGPLCEYRGLQLQFAAGGELQRQRALCQELMQEAALLATDLAWQRRHGVEVDWSFVSVSATPQRPEHMVVLNGAGDTLLATLPLIYSTDGLLQRLAGWLQAYPTAGEPLRVSLEAGELGWE